MASETHVFTPRLINEVRLGFNRVAAGAFQENQSRDLNQEVGLPEPWLNSRVARAVLYQPAGVSPRSATNTTIRSTASRTRISLWIKPPIRRDVTF